MSRLADEKNIWLVTVRADGRPHLAPIWFVHHDDRFWVCTGAGSVKVRNAIANPRVSLSLESGNDPVVVEGTATVHHVPFPQQVVEAFMAKFGWDIGPGFDSDLDQTVLIEIAVDRWLMGG